MWRKNSKSAFDLFTRHLHWDEKILTYKSKSPPTNLAMEKEKKKEEKKKKKKKKAPEQQRFIA